jgi:hypothetical protein
MGPTKSLRGAGRGIHSFGLSPGTTVGWLSPAVAYMFGDDQGPYLTALITYYGFLSLFRWRSAARTRCAPTARPSSKNRPGRAWSTDPRNVLEATGSDTEPLRAVRRTA